MVINRLNQVWVADVTYIRIRAGGYVIFSVRADTEGFKERQDKLERNNKWKLVEVTVPFVSIPLGEPDIKHRIFVYQVG